MVETVEVKQGVQREKQELAKRCRNYRNIASWNLINFNEENHKYMMKFYIAYSLIKCAKKAEKAAESAATPVS